jgi:hypothetical protein
MEPLPQEAERKTSPLAQEVEKKAPLAQEVDECGLHGQKCETPLAQEVLQQDCPQSYSP